MRAAPLLYLALAACAPDRPTPVRAEEVPPAVTASSSSPPAPAASASASASPSRPRKYKLRFEDADLPEMVRTIGAITGRRFVIGGGLPAIKASLYSPEEVTADEAYRAFLTILASNGLTVVPRGRFELIVRSPGVAP
jgi:general secretion pathway protein D